MRRLGTSLVAPIAVALIAAVPASAAVCSNGIETRPEIRTLSSTQYTKFVRALQIMQTPPAPGQPSAYDKFVKLHLDESAVIHNDADFLPWHRAFLLQFEQALQKIDPTVTIPYWDVGLDAQAPELSPVFTASEFGGNGDPNGELTDGPFAKWTPAYPTPHLLTRDWNPGPTTIYPFLSQTAIQNILEMSKTSFGLTQGLQLQHGMVHNYIGGDMETMDSPNDPLFWLLHAYIDKLWADWQGMSSANATSYDGLNADGSAASRSDALPGLGATVGSVMSISDLCYRYQAPNASGPSPGQAPATPLPPPPPPTTASGFPTTLSVTSSAAAITPDQSVTITASTDSTQGAGSVSFVVDGSLVSNCDPVRLRWTGRTWQAACRLSGLTSSPAPHAIVAEFPADGDFMASEATLSGGVLVSSAVPAVSFDAPAMAYYGDPIGAAALDATSPSRGSFSYTSAPVNDVTAMAPVTVNTVLHAGEYDLQAHFTPADGSQGQTITVPYVVDPAPLLIQPDNKYMARGQLTPELTWVAAGFVNGDTPHALLQSPVCSIALGPLTVGKHLIWCEGGGSPDYTISYPRTAKLFVLRHACQTGTTCATDPPPTPSQRQAEHGLQLICHPAIPVSNVKFLRGMRGVRKGVRKTTWRGRIT